MDKLTAVFKNLGLARVRWILYKEINSFFGSNLPPAVIGIVALLCGMVSALLSLSSGATYEAVTSLIFHLFYIIVIAAALCLSMSAFVGERRQGTMELLYTLPVTDLELVLGKYLMGVIFISLLSLAMTLVYIMGIAEAPLYMVVSGVTGLILVGLYAYGVGVFASSLTDSYLLSLLIGVMIVLVIDIGGFMAGLLPEPGREILTHMHGLGQFVPFTRGRIPLKGSVFFISLALFFLFLTVRVLESRRWRGNNS